MDSSQHKAQLQTPKVAVSWSVWLGSKKDSEEYGWKLIDLVSSLAASAVLLTKKLESLQGLIADSHEDPAERKKAKLKLRREVKMHDQSRRKCLEQISILTARSS